MEDYVSDSEMPQCIPDQPSRSNNTYEDSVETIVPDDEEEDQVGIVEGDGNILHIVKDWLKEVDEKWHELIKDIFSKVGKKFPLENFVKEVLEEDCDGETYNSVSDLAEKILEKVKRSEWDGDGSINADERGVDLDSREIRDEESTKKMERFKVKTIKLGGVVQENQK